MAKLTTHQIRDKARQIVANNKGGIRYSDLIGQIESENPETPNNTIQGSVWDLHIRYPQEISKPSQPVVAFGQAIAYRLFSTKTYIAMPTSMTLEDQSRLEALCILFGVGLVLFDLDAKKPNFQIRVRAQKFTPDMFYVNEFAERLKEFDTEKFEQLFR